jgi:hypothetical protein
MANVELQLLSNIIDRGHFQEVRQRGITASIFQSEEARELFAWIHAEVLRPGTASEPGGVVPSYERVRRTFPEFHFCPSRDTIDALLDEIINNNVAAGIREITAEMDDLLDEGEDPGLVLQGLLPALRDLSVSSSKSSQTLISGAAADLRAEYEAQEESGGLTGIPYPWAPMNRATGGMQDQEWLVLFARPKMMKTWLALYMCTFAYAVHGRRVLCYSKEMSKKQMIRRASSILASVDYERLKTASLNDEQRENFFDIIENLGKWEKEQAQGGQQAALSFISDRDIGGKRGATVDVLVAEAEKFQADLMLVDGFYLMRDGRTGVRDRGWKTISNISSDLKDAAQYLNIPIIGTTQANRASAKTKGEDTDEVAFADAIGQDCDLLARIFKAKNLATGKPKLMLTFPGVRDSVLNPFVVNAWPGCDFTLLQEKVNVDAFLKEAASSEDEEDGGNSNKQAEEKAAGRNRFSKPKTRKKVSPRLPRNA